MIFPPSARSQAPPAPPARVQLIWDGDPIHPGSKLWVGVLFQLDPGWHIYWQNPGDSGEPPKINWKLSPDYHGGAILWPRPVLLGSGSVRDFGYEGQVLLMAPLQTPRNLDPTVPAALAATVKYVVCREICIPAKADLTLSVPLRGQPIPEHPPWRDFFQKALAQLPRPLPAGWKASAISSAGNFVLSLEGPDAPSKLTFFPLDPGIIENAAPQTMTSDDNGVRLTLKKSDQLLKPITTLRGVIVMESYQIYEIEVPVRPS